VAQQEVMVGDTGRTAFTINIENDDKDDDKDVGA
jgi:hypothetical protein